MIRFLFYSSLFSLLRKFIFLSSQWSAANGSMPDIRTTVRRCRCVRTISVLSGCISSCKLCPRPCCSQYFLLVDVDILVDNAPGLSFSWLRRACFHKSPDSCSKWKWTGIFSRGLHWFGINSELLNVKKKKKKIRIQSNNSFRCGLLRLTLAQNANCMQKWFKTSSACSLSYTLGECLSNSPIFSPLSILKLS